MLQKPTLAHLLSLWLAYDVQSGLGRKLFLSKNYLKKRKKKKKNTHSGTIGSTVADPLVDAIFTWTDVSKVLRISL